MVSLTYDKFKDYKEYVVKLQQEFKCNRNLSLCFLSDTPDETLQLPANIKYLLRASCEKLARKTSRLALVGLIFKLLLFKILPNLEGHQKGSLLLNYHVYNKL